MSGPVLTTPVTQPTGPIGTTSGPNTSTFGGTQPINGWVVIDAAGTVAPLAPTQAQITAAFPNGLPNDARQRPMRQLLGLLKSGEIPVPTANGV